MTSRNLSLRLSVLLVILTLVSCRGFGEQNHQLLAMSPQDEANCHQWAKHQLESAAEPSEGLYRYYYQVCLSQVQASSDDSMPKNILVVGFSGWQSCVKSGLIQGRGTPTGSRIWDSLMNLVENIKSASGADVDHFVGCLDVLPPSNPLASIRYVTGRGGERVTSAAYSQSGQALKSYIAKTNPQRIYMMGHSYGAWVAANIIETTEVYPTIVAAFDLVDASKCLIRDYVVDVEGRCTSPAELDFQTILARSTYYINIWQSFGRLHSGPIEPAPRGVINNKVHVQHPLMFSDADRQEFAHRYIGSDPQAWTIFCQAIMRDLDAPQEHCQGIITDQFGRKINVR